MTTIDDDDHINLGACCACGEIRPDVRNIVILPYRAPVPRTGWGCFVCGLPNDGAVAVVCDRCLLIHAEIKDACHGYPGKNARVSVASLTGQPFDHDRTKHSPLD